MADPNLIALLYPAGKSHILANESRTISMPENASRRVEPLREDRTRPPSPLTDDGDGDGDGDGVGVDNYNTNSNHKKNNNSRKTNQRAYEYMPCLKIKFDDQRKHRIGLVFGTSSTADIVLPMRDSLEGLAALQCALTFDDRGRLILRDLQGPGGRKKKHGTAVTYDGQGGEKRLNSTWILGGDEFTHENRSINIEFHENLIFEIVVAQHDTTSIQYQQKVAQFRSGATATLNELSFNGLGFQSMGSTATRSGAQTPSGVAPILVDDKELGRGAQAVVTRVWDVSTGRYYAAKRPLAKHSYGTLVMELKLQDQISHDNIVQYILEYSTAAPVPELVLEYVPLGTLEDQAGVEGFSL